MANPLVHRVGRLHRLAVFEAAARLGSFTKAASELGITQPGVTRQIRSLEQSIGRPLFQRFANRIEVNDAGRALLSAVQGGFAVIDDELARIVAPPSSFVLAANPGVAQRWLVPRLDSLQLALGDIELHLRLFDRDEGVAAGGFDAAIHLGRGQWSQLNARSLFPEITVPVAAGEVAGQLGLTHHGAPQPLVHLDLLHLDSHDRTWMTWNDWFAAHGINLNAYHPTSRGRISYSNYALVLQDAIAGLGVALGWRFLIDDLLEQELLQPVGPEVANPGSSYQLLWPSSTPPELIERLVAWLDDELDLPIR